MVVLTKKPSKMDKSDPKLAEHSWTKGYHVNTIEQLKIFVSPKDVSYNLTKSFSKFLLTTLGVADEKLEGGGAKRKIWVRLVS